MGGSQTTKTKIPKWLQRAAQNGIARANEVSALGYTPHFGPDVAAPTQMQQSAFQNTANAASMFGLGAPTDAMAGMPQAQTFAGGVQGYSSAPMYQQALGALQQNMPGLYDQITGMFVDPITGQRPDKPFNSVGKGGGGGANQIAPNQSVGRTSGGGTGSGQSQFGPPSGASFTSIRDMFDGGGAGHSGLTFSGGPLSGAINSAGIGPMSGTGTFRGGR